MNNLSVSYELDFTAPLNFKRSEKYFLQISHNEVVCCAKNLKKKYNVKDGSSVFSQIEFYAKPSVKG